MALSEDSTNDSVTWDISITGKSWVEMVEEDDLEFARLNQSGTSSKPKSPSPTPTLIKQEPDEDEPLKNISLTYEKTLKKLTDPLPPPVVKKEPKTEPKDFLNDDLSLTGHLSDFRLVSPCKTETCGSVPTTPRLLRERTVNNEVESKLAKRKIIEATLTDEALMPSPSKISRANNVQQLQLTPRPDKEALASKKKRLRENSRGSSGKRGSGKKPPPEIETDPDVLMRRQKQIDYGKNTIGYDRYRQLVPKDSRKSVHPQTPPLHLKYSRRAWDGLVRIWRQRLHFWDPPSEGGGNPECLEIPSDISDMSSTDGSQPNTPIQDRKRNKFLTSDEKVSSIVREETEEQFLKDYTPLPD